MRTFLGPRPGRVLVQLALCVTLALPMGGCGGSSRQSQRNDVDAGDAGVDARFDSDARTVVDSSVDSGIDAALLFHPSSGTHVECRLLACEDVDGRSRVLDAEGFGASLLQHELDHLDGILTLDRATPTERRRATRELLDASQAPSLAA